MDEDAIKLRHKQQIDLLNLQHHQELELLEARKAAKQPTPPKTIRQVNGRRPIQHLVEGWLNRRPKGSQFTPDDISKAIDRLNSSVTGSLVTLAAQGKVRLLEGPQRGRYSYWEIL